MKKYSLVTIKDTKYFNPFRTSRCHVQTGAAVPQGKTNEYNTLRNSISITNNQKTKEKKGQQIQAKKQMKIKEQFNEESGKFGEGPETLS